MSTEEQVNQMVDKLLERCTTIRSLELLAYASVCFSHNTSPFETVHLCKMEVKADECFWLSEQISKILNDKIDYLAVTSSLKTFAKAMIGKEYRAEAEKKFQETQ
jgi:hypothetical protein